MANGVDAVRAGGRRRVELADDRSGEARGATSAPATRRRRRRRRRRTPSWPSISTPGNTSGRIRRPRTTCSWAAATAPNKSEACPKPMGPDMDIGNSPILKTLPNGKRVLIAGTKSADIFALDPDDNGKLLYRVHPLGLPLNGNGRGRASIVWGGAADDRLVYYGIGGAGLAAVQPGDRRARVALHASSARGRRPRARRLAWRGGDGDSRRGLRGRIGRHALRAVGERRHDSCGSTRPAKEFETINRVQPRTAARSHLGRRSRRWDGVRGIGIRRGIRRAGRQRVARIRRGIAITSWRKKC